ncbi:collagen-like triple helix repeat-containing protein [Paraburkholderia sediminicola]
MKVLGYGTAAGLGTVGSTTNPLGPTLTSTSGLVSNTGGSL